MVRIIRFKRRYLDLIIQGKKSITIRPADGRRYEQSLILTDGKRRVNTELIYVREDRLRNALRFYRQEGFNTPQELLNTLKSLYPGIRMSSRVNIIKFRPLNTDASK
ncbi:MAG: ASCH domain-containing protein [Aigarchaeota archaeon]|nr:ASCH domain-containing protein [Candidatus Pelearchaeum maunauluense]